MLHPLVIIVGDRPNIKKNLDMATPFVGTPSYKILLEWVYRMNLDISLVSMVNAYNAGGVENPGLLDAIERTREAGVVRIIALGKNAADRIAELQEGSLRPIQCFQLPHPSGLNRELNDKKAMGYILTKCMAWVYKK